uniref:Paired box 4 n=1 Tax=Pelodiscus sinensis TaxID=13735 RepID=K7FFF2_PELSI
SSPGASGVNQLGGLFVNGRPLPPCKRQRIIERPEGGTRGGEFAAVPSTWAGSAQAGGGGVSVSNGCVSKILARYHQTGAVGPKAGGGSKPRMANPAVGVSSINRVLRNLQEATWLAAGCMTEPSPPAWWGGGQTQHTQSLRGWESSASMPLSPSPLPGAAGVPWLGEARSQVSAEVLASQCPRKSSARGPLPGAQHRDRTIFSRQQAAALETEFQRGPYPATATRERLASATQLPDATIRVWFSNRRAKWRREAKLKLETDRAGDGPCGVPGSTGESGYVLDPLPSP